MPTLDVVKRLTIEATTRGVAEATAELTQLSGAQDQVVQSSARTEKATLSVDRAFERLQRRYDQEFRAQQQLAQVQRTLQQAQQQGLVTQARAAELQQLAVRSLNSTTESALTQRGAWRALGREIQLLSPELANVTGAFGGASVGLGRLGPAITAAALAVAGLVKSLLEFAQTETQLRQMSNAITLIGGASGESAESLRALTKELTATGTATKDSVIEAEKAIVSFRNLGAGTFREVLEAARQLSQTGLLSLADAAKAVGGALNTPVEATQELAKAFIQLDSGLQKQITSLARSGDMFGAQRLILQTVGERTAKLSDSSDTLAASWTRLVGSGNVLFSAVGDWIAKTTSLASTLDRLSRTMQEVGEFISRSDLGQVRPGQEGPGGIRRVIVPPAGTFAPTMAPETFAPILKGLEDQARAAQIAAQAARMGAGAAAAYTAAETARQNAIAAGTPLDAEQTRQIQEQARAIGAATAAVQQSNLAFEIRLQMMAATNKITEEQAAIVQRLVPLYGQDIPRALASAQAAQLTYIERLKEARKTTDEFASSFSTNLTQGLTDFATGSKTAAEAFKNFSTTVQAEIVRMVLRLTVMNQLERSLKDVLAPLGSAFTPSPVTTPAVVARSGGVLGLDSFPRTLAHSSVFDNAPRFQSGGVVPVLAHSGEGIFTPGQMRAMGQGEQNVVVNIENAPSTPQVEQSRGPGGEFNIRVIFDQFAARMADDMRRGRGPLASATAGRFGLNPARGNSANG